MSLTKETFQNLANNFIGDTFSAFKKTLVMRTACDVVFGTEQTYLSEYGKGIQLSIKQSQFQNTMVEAGDEMIFTNASDWSTDLSTDNIDILFDNVEYSIVDTQKDAANAAYFITVRKK